MSDKIFKSIWLVAASVFLASLIFIMGISYNYFTTLQKKQLKNETELAAQGVVLCGKSFFDSLNVENYRITWIAADGSVLYDSEANTARLSKTICNILNFLPRTNSPWQAWRVAVKPPNGKRQAPVTR